MLKAINFNRLSLLIVIFLVLAVFCGLVSVANDEVGFGNSGFIAISLVEVTGWIFELMIFPLTFITSVSFFINLSYTSLIGIIIFDCMLYGFIIELAFVGYKLYQQKNNPLKQLLNIVS